MFNQKLHAADIIEFEIAEELRYETDPCELKLDEMIEAEPEPEMIEGLLHLMLSPLPIVIWNFLSTYNRRACSRTAKPSQTVRRRWIRWIF